RREQRQRERDLRTALQTLYVADVRQARADWERYDLGAVRRRLAAARKSASPGFAWHYLDALTRPPAASVWPPETGNPALALAAARTIASLDSAGAVRLWSPDGRPLRVLRARGPAGRSSTPLRPALAVSPDGRWLAALDPSGTASVWDTAGQARERVVRFLFT